MNYMHRSENPDELLVLAAMPDPGGPTPIEVQPYRVSIYADDYYHDIQSRLDAAFAQGKTANEAGVTIPAEASPYWEYRLAVDQSFEAITRVIGEAAYNYLYAVGPALNERKPLKILADGVTIVPETNVSAGAPWGRPETSMLPDHAGSLIRLEMAEEIQHMYCFVGGMNELYFAIIREDVPNTNYTILPAEFTEDAEEADSDGDGKFDLGVPGNEAATADICAGLPDPEPQSDLASRGLLTTHKNVENVPLLCASDCSVYYIPATPPPAAAESSSSTYLPASAELCTATDGFEFVIADRDGSKFMQNRLLESADGGYYAAGRPDAGAAGDGGNIDGGATPDAGPLPLSAAPITFLTNGSVQPHSMTETLYWHSPSPFAVSDLPNGRRFEFPSGTRVQIKVESTRLADNSGNGKVRILDRLGRVIREFFDATEAWEEGDVDIEHWDAMEVEGCIVRLRVLPSLIDGGRPDAATGDAAVLPDGGAAADADGSTLDSGARDAADGGPTDATASSLDASSTDISTGNRDGGPVDARTLLDANDVMISRDGGSLIFPDGSVVRLDGSLFDGARRDATGADGGRGDAAQADAARGDGGLLDAAQKDGGDFDTGHADAASTDGATDSGAPADGAEEDAAGNGAPDGAADSGDHAEQADAASSDAVANPDAPTAPAPDGGATASPNPLLNNCHCEGAALGAEGAPAGARESAPASRFGLLLAAAWAAVRRKKRGEAVQ